jgi:O-antigen/teichoic acid export membrane protein
VTQTIAAEPATPEENVPSTAGMTTKVVKGSIWNLIGQILPLGASLIATPLVIRLLGSESYGVLILTGLIPSYFGFAESGMSLGSTKFGSEAFAAGDRPREAAVIRTSTVVVLATSLPISLGIFLFSSGIVKVFSVPEHLHVEASLALKIAAVTFVINFLNGVLNTPQLTRLRMDLNAVATSGFRIVGIVAAPIVIYFGGGIPGAVGTLLISSLLTLGGHIVISGRLLPELFGLAISRALLRPLLKFGLPVAATMVAAALLINLEKVVLARVASMETLAHYAVAFNFAGMATMFSSSMIQALTPAFSQLLTPDKRAQLGNLYSRAIRLNSIAIVPALVTMSVVAQPLFAVWAGPEFGKNSTMPFYLLLGGLFFNLLAYVSQALLISSGRTGVIAKLNWIELLPYIGLTALLSYRYGAVGAAAAWSIRVFADCFVVVWLAERLEGVSLDLISFAPRFLLALTAVVPVCLFAMVFEGSRYWLILLLPVSIAVYGIVAWMVLISSEERIFLKERITAYLSIYSRGFRSHPNSTGKL